MSVAGVHYDVDPDLAEETVVLWWGLFDNELYVEHSERRFGPYCPIGGPILCTGTAPSRKRQLSNAPSVSKHSPGSWHYPVLRWKAIPMPAHSSKPPMCQPSRSRTLTFQEFLSQRADGQTRHCGLLEAPIGQAVSNNAVRLTRSSPLRSRKDVIAQVRAYIQAATEGGTPC